jgi:DNA-binding winged helix-turn-helix (wHTH) protein
MISAGVLDSHDSGFAPLLPPTRLGVAAFRKRPEPVPALRFGPCEIRIASRELLVRGQYVALQPKSFDLLTYLIQHRDRVLTHEELLDQIWSNEVVQPGSVAAAILRIRNALKSAYPAQGDVIRSFARVGYRFVAEVEVFYA